VQQTSGYTGASALMTAARVRPAQGVSLVLERLCSSHLSIHEDDNGDVLRVRHQPRSMKSSPPCRRQRVRGLYSISREDIENAIA
jgi:hypothetical protein